MNIYALSPEKLDTSSKTDSTQGEHTEGQSITVNPEVSSAITLQIQNFIEGYRANDFGSVYSLKSEITTMLQNEFSATRTETTWSSDCRKRSGCVVLSGTAGWHCSFTVDGYEGLTTETFTESAFDKTKYEVSSLSDETKLKQEILFTG